MVGWRWVVCIFLESIAQEQFIEATMNG